MNNKKKTSLILIFLIGRLGFIFFDGFFNKEKTAENIVYFKNIGVDYKQEEHNAASISPKTNQTIQENNEEDLSDKLTKKVQSQNNHLQDIKTLEYLYKKEKSSVILKEIIKKQAQNYNFNEARNNIQKLERNWESIDIHLFIYIYLNSSNLNITQKESIKNFPEILDSAIQKNLIWQEDFIFYAWLIEIRNKNYSKALEQRQQIRSPEYQPIILSFQKAIKSYDPSKAIPSYYQDGLVALAALKNWYFTIARKIALETILQDENYILPYQILSYAHFLTNNRETAIEYFLKLASFDTKNTDTYQFLIWVSYYWENDFTSSILYLTQNKSAKYQTDTIRHLLVNYLEIDEYSKAIESWQKLLWQNDIKNSDFFLYFYNVFYKGYFSQNQALYNVNRTLSSLFIQECEKKLWIDDDVCIYWRIWSEVIEDDLSPANKAELITLAENYNQSYLYHILWDFANKDWKVEEAQKRYAKTIANSQDQKEIEVIQKKLY